MKYSLLLFSFIISSTCFADDYYTWRDSSGRAYITNIKPAATSEESVSIRHYSQEKAEHRQPSETFQQRIYNQLDENNSHRYRDDSQTEQQRKLKKEKLEKTIKVEKKMLEERIHYYKFDCANITDSKRHKDQCDSYQKLYEKKLKLLKRDPEEYFMREMR